MSYTETKVIEMDKGKKVGDPLIQGAYSVPYDNNNSVGDELDRINEHLSDILNVLHPVGSIYMSVDNTNPSTFFGGTWVSWGSGRVPVGVDANDTDFDTVEETGGAKSHSYTPSGSNAAVTLTAAQSGSRAHYHTPGTLSASSAGAHTHKGYYNQQQKAGGYNGYFFCETGDSGASSTGKAITVSDGAHTHQITGATEYNTNENATEAHNHTFTGTASTQSHLQPYITCYMWKRTA